MLLGERARERHRRHGAGKRERRDDIDLAVLGQRDQPLRHRHVELQG
jgi:hypothetical protein